MTIECKLLGSHKTLQPPSLPYPCSRDTSMPATFCCGYCNFKGVVISFVVITSLGHFVTCCYLQTVIRIIIINCLLFFTVVLFFVGGFSCQASDIYLYKGMKSSYCFSCQYCSDLIITIISKELCWKHLPTTHEAWLQFMG